MSQFRYKCQFPNCTYSTKYRFQLHYHHIVPKELGGTDKSNNRLWLCPNHHNRIYIPNTIHGIHSKKTDNSIIIIGWMMSTEGKTLCWCNANDPVQHIFSEG
jgi:hypothetical protein